MMAQQNNFSWCSTWSTTLTCYVKRRSLWTWLRWPQQDFILPPNIRLHRHPQCPNSCIIFCQTSSVLACRNCTVCQTMFMMLYGGHFITVNTCNNLIINWSWFVNLPCWDSGLFTFLTQILIWSYSVAVLSQLYWAWIQDKEFHTHILSNILFSIPPVLYSLLDHSVQVLVLRMICQTLFASKLAASLSVFEQKVQLCHVLKCFCHKGL